MREETKDFSTYILLLLSEEKLSDQRDIYEKEGPKPATP